MRPGGESLSTNYQEQVKTGISFTEKALQSFTGDSSLDLRGNRVLFKSGDVILEQERAEFLKENTVLTMFGEENKTAIDLMFGPFKSVTVADGSIMLDQQYYLPLSIISGKDIKTRESISNLEVIFFNFTASAAFKLFRQEKEVPPNYRLVQTLLDDFSSFTELIAEQNPDEPDLQRFRDDFNGFITRSNPNAFRIVTSGLSLRVCYEDKILFTEGYSIDQAMRFLLVNGMRKRFMDLMTKKYTWFSPAERVKKDIGYDPEDSHQLVDFLKKYAGSEQSIVGDYLSGEMGIRRTFEMESQLSKKALAEQIRQGMLSRKDDADLTRFASYDLEVPDVAKDGLSEEQAVEDEEVERITSRFAKKKTRPNTVFLDE